MTTNDRAPVSTLIRELANSMQPLGRDFEKVLHKNRDELYAEADRDIEAALAAKYRDKPLPPLSPELRAKLGAGIPEIAE